MEDNCESVDKSVDLDDPSERSVDLDDPGGSKWGSEGNKEVSDLPSDSSLGQLVDEETFQAVVPKLELSDGDDIIAGSDQPLVAGVENELDQFGDTRTQVVEVNNMSVEGDELVEEEGGPAFGREGRRCSARLRGKTRKRWSSEVRWRREFGLPAESAGSHHAIDNRLWSLEEKRQLLHGLRKYGSREVEKVAEEVPTKSFEQVAKKVLRDKRSASYVTETYWMGLDGTRTVIDSGEKISRGRPKLETLDLPECTPQGELVEVEKVRQRTTPSERWLEAVETADDGRHGGLDCSEALPSMLTWIAELEEHPDPSECGGVDYAAIYRYLAALCQGEAPPDLDGATSARASRILPSLITAIQGIGEKETAYLDNYRGRHTKYRYEDSFSCNSQAVREVEVLNRLPGINPLNFHPELLANKILPKLSTITQLFSDADKKEDISEEDENGRDTEGGEEEDDGDDEEEDNDDEDDEDYVDPDEEIDIGSGRYEEQGHSQEEEESG